ncbi:MAG: hypothetical protein P8186_05630 [Anaerolineae bacterium]|jgi:hypothetical protein
MSLLSWLLVTLAGFSLAMMVVSLIIANRSSREARATIFPIVREEETIRARRAHITASLMGVIAAIMAGAFFLSGQIPSPTVLPQQATAEAVAVVESLAVETAVPTATPVPLVAEPQTRDEATPAADQTSPTSQPTASETLPPTMTATPMPPSPTSTRAPSSTPTPVPPSPTAAGTLVPAPASAQMGPIAFATQITNRRDPISPTTVFSDTIDRVYAAFPYSGMQKGVNWTQVWYFNGIEFVRGQETWEWGGTDRSYVFTQLVGAGDYRLELYVNDELLASGEFTVQGPVAVGGPESPESPENP